MIAIRSFSLNNFTRKVWEFYDDKFVITAKSLNADYETEWHYAKIKEIRQTKLADLTWVSAGFMVLMLFFVTRWFLHFLSIYILDIPIVEKAIVILAIVLLLPAFRKRELYSFLDADGYYLTSIQVTQKSKKLLLNAIDLMKQKAEITDEIYLSDPLPGTSPLFKFQEFDFPDFLSKSTVRVYDDRLIDFESSLTEDIRTVVKFDKLSGKTTTARVGNKNWDNLWYFWLLVVIYISAIAVVFFPDYLYQNTLAFRIFLVAMFLLVPLHFLSYMKSEILVFYDKKDYGVFWTRVSPENREVLNQVVKFVQEKVQFNS
jgi:hypothetical protein